MPASATRRPLEVGFSLGFRVFWGLLGFQEFQGFGFRGLGFRGLGFRGFLGFQGLEFRV